MTRWTYGGKPTKKARKLQGLYEKLHEAESLERGQGSRWARQ